MTHFMTSPLGRRRLQRWLALPLSLALGAALVAVVLGSLRARSASAAGLADPTVNYLCTPAGLDSALAAGGSATFACGVPTTVTVSSRKNVPHNLSLDGTNTLILQGISGAGLFTVPAGIHLSLLNVTLRDATSGAIINNGVLNVSHGHFISDTEYAVWNFTGAAATLSDSTVEGVSSKIGALINGDFSITTTAMLTVVNSTLHDNRAGFGAAIENFAGTVTVMGSNFYSNRSFAGGAIWSQAQLSVSNSQFTGNLASQNIFDSQVPSLASDLAGPSGISISTGGAIFSADNANLIVSSSAFTDNFSTQGGGAIMFGALPLGSPITPTGASLTIAASTFVENCTGGPGGAVAASQKTTVSGSSFSFNFGDADPNPCVLWSTNHPNSAAQHAPDLTSSPAFTVPFYLAGSGGALFSSDDLAVDSSTFLTNTATISPSGGGGAITNFAGGKLRVTGTTFQDNSASYDGGAVFNDAFSVANILQGTFIGNSVQNDSGGAIANLGALTVTYSLFNGNSGAPGNGPLGHGGGAIESQNPLVAAADASNSPQTGNGGNGHPAAPDAPLGLGPANFLTLDHTNFISNASKYEGGALDTRQASINATTFQSNTARFGGAIDLLSNGVAISASTFIANAAVTTTDGGAQQGGAIDTNAENLSIVNSTFYHNRAQGVATGGAINQDGATLAITNSTFLSNTADTPGKGGAFAQGGAILLHNTLVAYNGSENCNSAVTLNGANLEFPGSTCGGASVLANPLALAPANNGGPTLTSALLPASPAINTGDDSGCPSTDQRGAHRPFGPHCDIGAFEFGGQVPWLWLPFVHK